MRLFGRGRTDGARTFVRENTVRLDRAGNQGVFSAKARSGLGEFSDAMLVTAELFMRDGDYGRAIEIFNRLQKLETDETQQINLRCFYA